MNKLRTRFAALSCAAFLAILFFLPANFALAKKHSPPARKHQTLITRVSPTSLTIHEDAGPKTFSITPFTEVMVDDQKASVGQLKNGMRVSVTLDDPTHVRQIKAWHTD